MAPKNVTMHETRWSRIHEDRESGSRFVESRFRDGSATITLKELTNEWHKWSAEERLDFCRSFLWAQVPDRQDILRFVIDNGDHNEWATIASMVPLELPPDESIRTLKNWCTSCEVGRGSNYYQAVALTGNPEAHSILQDCLRRILATNGLMDSVDFNWVAYDATCCVEYILKLNDNSEICRKVYDLLSSHPCQSIREQVEYRLTKYFSSI